MCNPNPWEKREWEKRIDEFLFNVEIGMLAKSRRFCCVNVYDCLMVWLFVHCDSFDHKYFLLLHPSTCWVCGGINLRSTLSQCTYTSNHTWTQQFTWFDKCAYVHGKEKILTIVSPSYKRLGLHIHHNI